MTRPVVDARWNPASRMLVLGHKLDENAGVRFEWSSLRPRLWGLFWQNAGSAEVRNASFDKKCELLSRTVLSGMAWLFCRWPYQKAMSVEMDNLQGRMMSVLAKVPRESHESVEIWFKKRQKVGAELARKVGLWSSIWCKRVCESCGPQKR